MVGKQGIDGIKRMGNTLWAFVLRLIISKLVQHKIFHRYSWVRVNKRSLVEYIAVDDRMKHNMSDAKVLLNGSGHFVVETKVKIEDK